MQQSLIGSAEQLCLEYLAYLDANPLMQTNSLLSTIRSWEDVKFPSPILSPVDLPPATFRLLSEGDTELLDGINERHMITPPAKFEKEISILKVVLVRHKHSLTFPVVVFRPQS